MPLIKNPEKLNCPHCYAEKGLRIWDVEKLYTNEYRNDDPRPLLEFKFLIHCPACLSSTSYIFTGFRYKKAAIKHVRSILLSQKSQKRIL
jgi:hypothetical protein